MKSPEEVIESLKIDKLIKNRDFNPEIEDDLAEIISSAWVNQGDDKEVVTERLKILMPNLPDIKELITKGGSIAVLEQAVEQSKVKEAPTPFKELNLIERSNLLLSQKEVYETNKANYEESQRLFKIYESKNKRLEGLKSSFSELDKKIYNKIEESGIESKVRARLNKENLAEKLTLESVDPINYQFSFAKNDKYAFVEGFKNIQLTGDALKEFAESVLGKDYDAVVQNLKNGKDMTAESSKNEKIDIYDVKPFEAEDENEIDSQIKFDEELKSELSKRIELKIKTDGTGRCQISIPREIRDGKVINPEYSAETTNLNAVIDSLKREVGKKPNLTGLHAVLDHVAILKDKVNDLSSHGFEKKANEILIAIGNIEFAVSQYLLYWNNPNEEYKQAINVAEDSVNKALPLLSKSLGNELSNLWTRFTNLILKENKPLIVSTDSAKKMLDMKQQFNELFSSEDDDNTNTPTHK